MAEAQDGKLKFRRVDIESAPAPASGGVAKYQFEDMPGLRLTVAKSGARRFFVRFMNEETGKRDEVRLGAYPDFPDLPTLKQRYQEARLGLRKPVSRKTQEERDAETVAFWVERYFAIKTSARETKHYKNERSTANTHILPNLGARRVRDVRCDEIEEIVDRLKAAGTPGAARNFHVTGRRIFETARKALKGKTPFENPFDDVPTPTTMIRERTATDDEVRLIWPDLIRRMKHAATRPQAQVIALAFLTGQRMSEVSYMTTDELSPDLTAWIIPKERTKRFKLAKKHAPKDHEVPLSAEAQAIVRAALEALPKGHRGYVFPGRGKSERMGANSPSQAFADLCDEVGIEDLHFHDIRRSAASRLADLQFSVVSIEGLMNHALAGITQRYVHATQEEATRRELVDALAADLRKVLGVSDLMTVPPRPFVETRKRRPKKSARTHRPALASSN